MKNKIVYKVPVRWWPLFEALANPDDKWYFNRLGDLINIEGELSQELKDLISPLKEVLIHMDDTSHSKEIISVIRSFVRNLADSELYCGFPPLDNQASYEGFLTAFDREVALCLDTIDGRGVVNLEGATKSLVKGAGRFADYMLPEGHKLTELLQDLIVALCEAEDGVLTLEQLKYFCVGLKVESVYFLSLDTGVKSPYFQKDSGSSE
ncbi:hypothetical protein [Paenibacillus glucanolyticus]|uniref:hypothetical protein n=1 Tax=Paenibacillus glucanolyticus TaxID=59843 RepID=UPI00096E045C|nr:hypothetical protein [Paenibacillus glucanolyticus]OMF76651.1 hypothetical protein BK142_14085 [Paenibacillus glucanolyticus]